MMVASRVWISLPLYLSNGCDLRRGQFSRSTTEGRWRLIMLVVVFVNGMAVLVNRGWYWSAVAEGTAGWHVRVGAVAGKSATGVAVEMFQQWPRRGSSLSERKW
ncbi:polygalacturonase [Iris pallida]|uniref:Polygalacturonase n=1 Tax=Iris pallida TaxID=29817 RepID=A0AAX6EVP8_IRIPA|nr:polygalacturonase [Iris pallida]